MEDMELIKNCIVNNCNEKNTFVGIKYENGNIEIRFPFGYRLSKEHIREDILLLLEVLSNNTKQIKSNIVDNVYNINDRYHKVDFPIQAYIFIIKDFYRRGYYKEYNIDYKVGKNGKINWNRTIKTQKKYIQKNDVFYLDFVVKSNRINENQIITMIHEYCVYESFKKIGWLFNKFVPKKPRIKKCLKLFLSILYNKIQNTFNNNNKFLFRLCHNKQLINSHFYRGVSELPYKLLFAVIYTHLEFRYEVSHTITSHHVHHFHQTRIPDGTLLDYMVQYRKPLSPQFFLCPKKFLSEDNPPHKEFHLRPYIQNNANQQFCFSHLPIQYGSMLYIPS